MHVWQWQFTGIVAWALGGLGGLAARALLRREA